MKSENNLFYTLTVDKECIIMEENNVGKPISKAVIKRLPRYYRYLDELMREEVERVSSSELSKRMKVTASQIRQDFNNFGGFGQQGYGYNVKFLYTEIGKILGVDTEHTMIIIGAGNLGQALANYSNFAKRGFIVKGLFDISPEIVGKQVGKYTVRHVDTLEEFLDSEKIDIAALAIPKAGAGPIATRLVTCGVTAFWNFSHIDLDLPKDVLVENVHLSESLMRLSYNINHRQDRMD